VGAWVQGSTSRVIQAVFSQRYPVAIRGEGVWLEAGDGRRYLDAMSGGSMAATLGYGRRDLVEAGATQLERIAHIHNEHLTNPWQERLGAELVEVAPPGFGYVRFVSGGAEANELAVQVARAYHVERGETARWQVITPAQAYHGPTFETLALTGRPGLWGPFEVYLPKHLHVPPSNWHTDPTGEHALRALDGVLERAGPETISLFFMEPVSAAALPGYSPPKAFWEGLEERRRRHGFLIGFDEVVTGMGRTGAWFAGCETPLVPDLITTAKGLGAGYAPIGAVLCTEAVWEAFWAGSGRFPLGHTWDGSPLPCAVGLGVMEALRREGLVAHVAERGAKLAVELAEALSEVPMVRRVEGRGYLLGVQFGDPRHPTALLPKELGVAHRVDTAAMEAELITLSTQPTGDGLAGDQTLFAPAFVASDAELEEMVARLANVVGHVWRAVEPELEARQANSEVGQ